MQTNICTDILYCNKAHLWCLQQLSVTIKPHACSTKCTLEATITHRHQCNNSIKNATTTKQYVVATPHATTIASVATAYATTTSSNATPATSLATTSDDVLPTEGFYELVQIAVLFASNEAPCLVTTSLCHWCKQVCHNMLNADNLQVTYLQPRFCDH